ncbi:MAG TPA: type IV toxin-antitoxin system AbiEi family antitoxin domain-containing protein [Solirubrobacteraceae bacterium]|nr:type IV toxin-antitoxin system AbiEi family antitoxin domain-containing protein [Solirubrobacteraceae bacterium]
MGPFAPDSRESKGPPTPDERVAALAGRQHGVISRRQLEALGIGRAAITTRVERGSLHRLYPGVYAVGHTALSPRGRWLAAVGACGPNAALSHTSAGALRGFRDTGRAVIDVTTPDRGRKGHPGIALHRVRHLDPADVTTVDGVRVTTVARTLVDLATVLPQDALEKAVHETEVRRLLDVQAVHEAITRAPGRRTAALAALIVSPDVDKPHLERLLLKIVDRAGLPRPILNAMVHGHEADALWPQHRLIVELDGERTHLTRKRFRTDRRRDVELLRHGIVTVRLTHDDLTTGACRTEAALLDLLAEGARTADGPLRERAVG